VELVAEGQSKFMRESKKQNYEKRRRGGPFTIKGNTRGLCRGFRSLGKAKVGSPFEWEDRGFRGSHHQMEKAEKQGTEKNHAVKARVLSGPSIGRRVPQPVLK